MNNRIEECINGTEGSYVLPFLWLHGESHDKIAIEIDAIYNSGIKEICFESRTHDNFCEDKWWEDFKYILEECKKRDMYVWLLDDKHFPTGYANGAIEKKYPHLRKKNVRINCIDVAGPLKGGAIISDRFDKSTESLISVSAFKRTGHEEEVDGSTGIVLTNNVKDGLVFWDIPKGVWRIFFVIRTKNGPAHFKNYIDMCDAESCKVMINEIYEPHYERFGEYFGNTFKGFFSDEPCFANNIGSYYDKLGTTDLILPWRDDMIDLIAKKSEMSINEVKLLLPALWYKIVGKTALMRLSYMEIITCLYRDNFSNMIGNWCRDHNVLYIGHVIEDMNAHMRTGYGSGHFFRALEGQDMSGMDIVLHQLIPGITSMRHTYSASGKVADPKFFFNTLAKLTSSASHLDPKKKNRAMCELYGAFGWAEGLPMMKYLTDCMLVNGINHFVPHAFTPKENDPDCPPYFYANGTNPQYPIFRMLMEYVQKACHVLYGGTHRANAAVFYNAEGEWSGYGNMLFQEVATKLAKEQIDYDFVPTDVLVSSLTSVKDNKLVIGKEMYDALVISTTEVLPKSLLETFSSLSSKGLRVVFIDSLPDRTEAIYENGDELNYVREEAKRLCENFLVVPLNEITGFFRENNFIDIELEGNYPDVRAYHISDKKAETYFFFNASLDTNVDTYIKNINLCKNSYIEYDIWNNKVYRGDVKEKRVELHLPPGQSTVISFVDEIAKEVPVKEYIVAQKELCSIQFNVSIKEKQEFIYFDKMDSVRGLRNLATELPRFCGVVRYEGDCNNNKQVRFIDLGDVGEIAQLWVNDINCGAQIRKPYMFDVSKAWIEGANHITIEITSNIAYRERDGFSNFLALPPTGLLGPILYV